MVTRIERLSDFSTDAALDDAPLELLCEDHRGTYVLPYPCILSGSVWRNAATSDQILADVIGWRLYGTRAARDGNAGEWPESGASCCALQVPAQNI
jgi:hypothetical protein